jgi:Toxin co-regulated pilus biosynthesis protein Q
VSVFTHIKRACALLSLAFVALHTLAQSTEPFDFEYKVISREAGAAIRPAAVFNDGRNTYVQTASGQILKPFDTEFMRQGTYLVTKGVPDVLTFYLNERLVTAMRIEATTAFNTKDDAFITGVYKRLGFIGDPKKEMFISVVSFASTNELRHIIKAIVPPGWVGKAHRDVSALKEIKFASVDGESWIDALNRALATANYYAEIDWEKKQVFIKADPPSSVASGQLVWVAPNLVRDRTGNMDWVVLPRETLLSDVLKRWGEQSGYDVRWHSKEKVPIGAGRIQAADFVEALTTVLKDVEGKGYEINAQVFSNKVVRLFDKGVSGEK